MAWAFKTSASGHAPSIGPSSANVVVTIDTTGVDLIWAGAAVYQDGSYPTISDNHSASWTPGSRADDAGGNRHLLPWYLFSPATDVSYQITFDTAGGGNFMSAGVLAFSGSSGVFGAQVPSSSGALGTVSGKNCDVANASGVTTTEDNMLLIAGIASDGEFNKIFDPSGGSTWVDVATNLAALSIAAASGQYVGFAASYRILGAGTSPVQYGVRFNEPNFVVFDGGGINIMSFKMASAAAGIPNRVREVNQAVNRAATF